MKSLPAWLNLTLSQCFLGFLYKVALHPGRWIQKSNETTGAHFLLDRPSWKSYVSTFSLSLSSSFVMYCFKSVFLKVYFPSQTVFGSPSYSVYQVDVLLQKCISKPKKIFSDGFTQAVPRIQSIKFRSGNGDNESAAQQCSSYYQ